MARKTKTLLTLPGTRDIPFSSLVLADANVRRVATEAGIADLAEDIGRRGLLQSLAVRPELDTDGEPTGRFLIPAGGRRFRALGLLVEQKRLAPDAAIPCVVKAADSPVSAEEDSLAENDCRQALHPLDEFRAMQRLVDRGDQVETIAATFRVSVAVVRQRLRLASVAPSLLDIYAADEMSLDQLMAFTVSDDHARQCEVWAAAAQAGGAYPRWIRDRLTHDTVRASDKRVRYVGIAAYEAAGGGVQRDLFATDEGVWLTDGLLLDQLVAERLQADAAAIVAEGWRWVEVAADFPYSATYGLRRLAFSEQPLSDEERERITALSTEANALEDQHGAADEIPDEVAERIAAIDEEIGNIETRPLLFDPEEIALGGAYVSIDHAGGLRIERGFVRAEDEPAPAVAEDAGDPDAPGDFLPDETDAGEDEMAAQAAAEPEEVDLLKPLPDRLVCELTAYRTLALQDAVAQAPDLAARALLHALVLAIFYTERTGTCLGLSIHHVGFAYEPPALRESVPARAIDMRQEAWAARLPEAHADLWAWIAAADEQDRQALLSHCVAFGINARWEPVNGYDGRTSTIMIERRVAHADVLAREAALDMVAAGWTPTTETYLDRVPKVRILEAVTEAVGPEAAMRITPFKKGDMAREAERLLDGRGWLPEPLRTTMPDPATASDQDMSAVPLAEAAE